MDVYVVLVASWRALPSIAFIFLSIPHLHRWDLLFHNILLLVLTMVKSSPCVKTNVWKGNLAAAAREGEEKREERERTRTRTNPKFSLLLLH